MKEYDGNGFEEGESAWRSGFKGFAMCPFSLRGSVCSAVPSFPLLETTMAPR